MCFRSPAWILVGAIVGNLVVGCASGPDPQAEREELVRQYSRLSIILPEEGASVSDGQLPIVVDFSKVVADLSDIVGFELVVNESADTPTDEPTNTIRIETFTRAGSQFSFLLSLAGAVDQTEYRLTLRPVLRSSNDADQPLTWSSPRRWTLSLDLPVATPTYPLDGGTVLGTVAVLQWDGPEDQTYRVEFSDNPAFASSSAASVSGTQYASSSSYPVNQTVYWRVVAVGPEGIAGPPSETFRFRPSLDTPPAVPFEGSVPAIVAFPYIRWEHMAGARRHEIELTAGGTPRTYPLTTNGFRLSEEVLSELFADAGSSRTVSWRVRSFTEQGESSPWTEPQMIDYLPLIPAMIPVLRRGTIARFQPDDTETTTATLIHPFVVSRTELTNRLIAELATFALERGIAEISDGVLHEKSSDIPLLGLETLDLGEQFGLAAGPDDASVVVVSPDRAGHPAVGLSWYGATSVANAVSYFSGFTPAYARGQRIPGADGFRLPTETEWVYTESLTFPRGFVAAGYSGGRVNYFRSGDVYEDNTEPFTGRGGPTVPVAFLANGGPTGIYDLLGNVWEWCDDWYASDSFPPDDGAVNPRGPAIPATDAYGLTKRVVRGGAWNTRSGDMVPGIRGSFAPDKLSYSIGVRLVRSPN